MLLGTSSPYTLYVYDWVSVLIASLAREHPNVELATVTDAVVDGEHLTRTRPGKSLPLTAVGHSVHSYGPVVASLAIGCPRSQAIGRRLDRPPVGGVLRRLRYHRQ